MGNLPILTLMRKAIPLAGIVIPLSSPAFAANSVIIEQVGNTGSISVQQRGKDNTAKIRQENTDPLPVQVEEDRSVSPLGSPPSINAADYQKAILDNPYTSPRARAQAVAGRNSATQQETDKKSETDKIRIHQNGKGNTITTSQEGDSNDLLIEQEGRDTQVNRTQTGRHNRSRIIQNGEVVEDTETEQ